MLKLVSFFAILATVLATPIPELSSRVLVPAETYKQPLIYGTPTYVLGYAAIPPAAPLPLPIGAPIAYSAIPDGPIAYSKIY